MKTIMKLHLKLLCLIQKSNQMRLTLSQRDTRRDPWCLRQILIKRIHSCIEDLKLVGVKLSLQNSLLKLVAHLLDRCQHADHRSEVRIGNLQQKLNYLRQSNVESQMYLMKSFWERRTWRLKRKRLLQFTQLQICLPSFFKLLWFSSQTCINCSTPVKKFLIIHLWLWSLRYLRLK